MEITNWCYGLNEPRATDIARLALYFNVSADYLLGLEDDTGTKTVISNYRLHNTFAGFKRAGKCFFDYGY